ncbi:MAG: hemerythrin domain-containing protein [Povalibacter sp.]
MARATQSRNSDKPQDAIALLKQDHRTVEQLFEQFEDTEEGEGIPIAQQVCQLLTIHTQIEEEILYPAAKEALAAEDEEEAELVYEAEVEHASAKDLIAKIEDMTEQDEQYNATVKVLSEYVKHHVKEEEGEFFPALKKTELDLKELGSRLADRKQQLMTAMGVAEPEQQESSPRRRASTKSRSTKAKAHVASRAKSKSSGRSARH